MPTLFHRDILLLKQIIPNYKFTLGIAKVLIVPTEPTVDSIKSAYRNSFFTPEKLNHVKISVFL